MSFREETLREIEDALTDEGMRPAAVHALVGHWSRVTIRHCLTELVRQGRATFEGADCNRRYRRAAKSEAA